MVPLETSDRVQPTFRAPIGFADGLHARDTGWVRFGFRDYDPLTGRFTAMDPLGYAAGDPDLYGYCLDDPVNAVDPLGLFEITPGDIASAAITFGTEVAKQAKKIPVWGATTATILTAPLGDMISPTELNEGEDFELWKRKAVEEGYIDIFDTESEREQRIRSGQIRPEEKDPYGK
ncbi:MAG: RHS repeat-associated core domain-containing protein [Desulfovibrionaceae bacterium]